VFLLVPAHLGSPGQRAVKRLLCITSQLCNSQSEYNDKWNACGVSLSNAAHASQKVHSPTPPTQVDYLTA